jgi:hypothetical protein
LLFAEIRVRYSPSNSSEDAMDEIIEQVKKSDVQYRVQMSKGRHIFYFHTRHVHNPFMRYMNNTIFNRN